MSRQLEAELMGDQRAARHLVTLAEHPGVSEIDGMAVPVLT